MDIQNKEQWNEAFFKACKNGEIEDVRHLCQKQYLNQGWADIHINDEGVFRSACEHGRLDIVKYLLTSTELKEAGHTFANLHVDEEYGFRIACAYGHLELVRYLLTSKELKEAGHTFADLHVNLGFNNESGFFLACANGHLELVRYLLTSPELIEAGHTWATVHHCNDDGFYMACECEHWNVVRWLVMDYGIKKTMDIEEIIQDHPQAKEYFRAREELQEINAFIKETSVHHQDHPLKEDERAAKKAKKL